MSVQRGVDWMMRTLITIDTPVAADLDPLRVERVTVVTDPLGAPLPGVTSGALLDAQLALTRALPIRR